MRHGILTLMLMSSATLAMAQAPQDDFGANVPLPPAMLKLLDPNGDGKINDDEAKKAEAAFLRLPKTRLPVGQEVRKALDANGDRKIDEDEAKRGVERGKTTYKGVAAEVTEMVKQLDTDGDQQISPEEFRGLVNKLGVLGVFIAPRLGQFFNRMDADRDGKVSLVEAQEGTEYLTDQFKLLQEEQRVQTLKRDPLFLQAQRVFTALDKNKDNLISRDEARKNKLVSTAFLSIDTSLDDHLSMEECFEFVKAKAKGK